MGIVLLRHTKPDIADGTCYGVTDLKPGANLADEARHAIANLPWKADQILSSPLVRCASLADHISIVIDILRRRCINLGFGSSFPFLLPKHLLLDFTKRCQVFVKLGSVLWVQSAM